MSTYTTENIPLLSNVEDKTPQFQMHVHVSLRNLRRFIDHRRFDTGHGLEAVSDTLHTKT